MQPTNLDRLARACCALEGLSVGDAFGERFFVHPDLAIGLIVQRAVPAPPWRYTDDTEMALSIVATLRRHAGIDQEVLARSFGERYDPSRGYGPAMHRLLARIRGGEPWQTVAPNLFAGQGSYGNGAAMRVAPVGAYFADDMDMVVEHARRSAEVTHAHEEGIAGAIAVAAAAAWVWRIGQGGAPSFATLLDLVLPLVPESEVRSRLSRANDLSPGVPSQTAAAMLGNGANLTAQDTVPFALWCGSADTGHAGYVTRFEVRAAFLERYPVQVVGNTTHAEYWIPAEDLDAFNANIVGSIEVIAEFRANPD